MASYLGPMKGGTRDNAAHMYLREVRPNAMPPLETKADVVAHWKRRHGELVREDGVDTYNGAGGTRGFAEHPWQRAGEEALEVPQLEHVVTKAFERCAYPKVVRKLKHEDVIVRIKALKQANECLSVGEYRASLLEAGCVPQLGHLLLDPTREVRSLSCVALQYAAVVASAVDEMLEHRIVYTLMDMMNSEIGAGLRLRAVSTLLEISLTPEGKAEMQRNGSIPRIVGQMGKESGDNLGSLLELLRQITVEEVGLDQAAECGAVRVVCDVIKGYQGPEHVQVRDRAILTLSVLAATDPYKEMALECEVMPALVTHLSADHIPSVMSASAACMALTVTKSGKQRFVACDGCKLFTFLLRTAHTDILINTLQLMTNAADDPEGRRQIREQGDLVEVVRHKVSSNVPIVERMARIAERMITFEYAPTKL